MSQSGPLAGVRVLDLARILAGPWAGQVLADLGADVVKVESVSGDDTRAWGPPFVAAADGGDLGAAYYHSCNRGKRSITADFASPEGSATVRRLAVHADIVIENFKVGGLKKFGLDAQSLRALKPSLIVCSITGFGQTGPYASRAGYDFIIQGMGGIMDVTGEPDGNPMRMGVAYADIFTGLYSVIGILAALRRRDETGEGAHIDMALLDTQASLLQAPAMNYFVSGETPQRMGTAHPNLVPYEVVPASDGAIILAVGNDRQFRHCCEVLGCAELADDERYATNAGRVVHRAVLMPLLKARTVEMTRATLAARLEEKGVPQGPINTVPEVFADPQIVHRGVRVDLAAPHARAGSVPSLRTPIVIDGAAQVSPRVSPELGGDQRDVLADPAWGGEPA
ncbi:MAG: CaiB/BaiF CoA transferase family protein [Alphaproteobacteria bacterium]